MIEAGQTINIQHAVHAEGVPAADEIREWVASALQQAGRTAELTVRIVDEAEITTLNRRYRGKEGATNVLSFPYEPVAGVTTDLLGDIAICAPVIATESVAQGKPLQAHWAHIVIHGVLHLLGHDHHQEAAAEEMEHLEKELLAGLGYPDPY